VAVPLVFEGWAEGLGGGSLGVFLEPRGPVGGPDGEGGRLVGGRAGGVLDRGRLLGCAWGGVRILVLVASRRAGERERE